MPDVDIDRQAAALRAWVCEEFNWLARSVGQRFRYLREKREAIEGREIDKLPLSRARVPERPQ